MECMVAVDQNWGIGAEGGLLFPISADLKRFRAFTEHQVVIMGRKTLLSLPHGKPLKNRQNIVLSADPAFWVENAAVCANAEELLRLLKEPAYADKTHMVIGGAQVYRLLLPYCTKAHITHVAAAGNADCFFPNLQADQNWVVDEKEPPLQEDGLIFQYVTYRNVALLAL